MTDHVISHPNKRRTVMKKAWFLVAGITIGFVIPGVIIYKEMIARRNTKTKTSAATETVPEASSDEDTVTQKTVFDSLEVTSGDTRELREEDQVGENLRWHEDRPVESDELYIFFKEFENEPGFSVALQVNNLYVKATCHLEDWRDHKSMLSLCIQQMLYSRVISLPKNYHGPVRIDEEFNRNIGYQLRVLFGI